MLRALRYHFARKAYIRADDALRAYQASPAGQWRFHIAYALQGKADRAGARFIAAADAS